MPRSRPKPCNNLVSEELLKEIKSIRPLRLFISKQKKKGNTNNPFNLRVKFCKLSPEKQARFLQKSVDKYIELLDERDLDERLQIECKLFDYLLMKSEQKKYFQSINAPTKPPGSAIPYYTQTVKQDTEDETDWNSLSTSEQQNYKKRRKEATMEYTAQVQNFANDLPERLRTDYLSFAQRLPPKPFMNGNTSLTNGHVDSTPVEPIRQRRKSLTPLPDSLRTILTEEVPTKLTRNQLDALHKCLPASLYYESEVSEDEKPTFTRTMTKNAYIRSLFHDLDDETRLKYISKAVRKWNEFLQSNPLIIEKQIPTLHLLLTRNEDMILYFSSIGLPQRPPINSYLLFNLGKDESSSSQVWSDLSQNERTEYAQQLVELKNEYYQKLVQFVEKTLTSDHLRYEFFRNVKYAIKDCEIAMKIEVIEKNTDQWKFWEFLTKKTDIHQDINQCNQIKEKLFATNLTNEQKNLVEELTQLLYKYIE